MENVKYFGKTIQVLNSNRQHPKNECEGCECDQEPTNIDVQGRTTMLYNDITPKSAANVIASMIALRDSGVIVVPETQEKDSEMVELYQDIDFIISTDGGNVFEMFSIYDMMVSLKEICVIRTIGLGKVMSAGLGLICAGTPGERFAGQHTRFMIHGLSGYNQGNIHELRIDNNEIKLAENKYVELLEKNTKLSRKKLLYLVRKKTDTYFDAAQALQWGFIDHII